MSKRTADAEGAAPVVEGFVPAGSEDASRKREGRTFRRRMAAQASGVGARPSTRAAGNRSGRGGADGLLPRIRDRRGRRERILRRRECADVRTGPIGEVAAHVGEARRVAIFTDARGEARMRGDRAEGARGPGTSSSHDATTIEPTSAVVPRGCLDLARDGRFEAYVSIGGGSVIDTCKAAALYATYPAELDVYVNAPMARARPFRPSAAARGLPDDVRHGQRVHRHAVFDHVGARREDGHRVAPSAPEPRARRSDGHALRPAERASSRRAASTCLPRARVLHCAGFSRRVRVAARPMSQGRNPWSDLGALRAPEIGGKYIVRAVTDPSDGRPREELAWAATLAGIAFGNAGATAARDVYSVAGRVHDRRALPVRRLPQRPPHGPARVLRHW